MHAENELFDAACDVLEATRRLVAAARDEDCERAMPATLGCLSSALASLADATAYMRAHAAPDDHPLLSELARTLSRAARAADGARSASALPP
jgi:hypothetical protein